MTTENWFTSESQYLPPVSWFVQIQSFEGVYINELEEFRKSSLRNRCFIAGANGPIRLTIALIKGRSQHGNMKEVRIAYDAHWQNIHWQSICSAYGKAPFFIYYKEEFEKLFNTRFEFLTDFNFELLKACFRCLKIEKKLSRGNELLTNTELTISATPRLPEYRQVFEERLGFIKDLSIIDLLFNLGPDAKSYISKH